MGLTKLIISSLLMLLFFMCYVSAGDKSELDSLKAALLEKASSFDDSLKAINRLGEIGSPKAVDILLKFLTSHNGDRKLKQRALVTLGKIGTKYAIKAIEKFERWSRKRFTDPPPFRFGKKDFAIDHFQPHNLRALARTTDDKGKEWAIFFWYRYGRWDLWLTSSIDGDRWSQPILLDLPGLRGEVRGDFRWELSVNGDFIGITIDIKSQISRYLSDSDGDHLPDIVERRLLTSPVNPDSDGDGIIDGLDSNPLTPKHKGSGDIVEIRQAVFSALFATSNSQDAIVIVERGDFAKQEYYGYSGFVLRSSKIRRGFVNITKVEVKVENPSLATAEIVDWEGLLAASGHKAKLRKIHGKWVVVEFQRSWVS